jgi:hypothetical protein
MRYIAFIKHKQDYRGIKPPAALIEAMGAFVGENLRKGKFVDGAGLQSTHRAKKIQLRNGHLHVVDGPFTESKEIVGGYTILEVESEAEALELAKQFVELHRLYSPDLEIECELRAMQTGEPGSE